MKYTTVFIDLDDTLLDTVANTVQTLEELFTDYSLYRYFDDFGNFFSIFQANNVSNWHRYEHNEITKDELIRERFLAPFRPVGEVSDEQALAINEDYIGRIVKKGRLIEGARELLHYLKSKYKICTISNGFTEMQYTKIENAGLTGYFDSIILSDAVGVNKPDKAIFDYALREMQSTAGEVIMIGDSYFSDITGACNSSIDQVWFNPHNKPAGDIVPTYSVRALKEIESIV